MDDFKLLSAIQPKKATISEAGMGKLQNHSITRYKVLCRPSNHTCKIWVSFHDGLSSHLCAPGYVIKFSYSVGLGVANIAVKIQGPECIVVSYFFNSSLYDFLPSLYPIANETEPLYAVLTVVWSRPPRYKDGGCEQDMNPSFTLNQSRAHWSGLKEQSGPWPNLYY